VRHIESRRIRKPSIFIQLGVLVYAGHVGLAALLALAPVQRADQQLRVHQGLRPVFGDRIVLIRTGGIPDETVEPVRVELPALRDVVVAEHLQREVDLPHVVRALGPAAPDTGGHYDGNEYGGKHQDYDYHDDDLDHREAPVRSHGMILQTS
jgi:hypothetical protein